MAQSSDFVAKSDDLFYDLSHVGNLKKKDCEKIATMKDKKPSTLFFF